MTTGALFTLALRVIGFWVLLSAVEFTAMSVGMVSTSLRVQTHLIVEVGVTAFAKAALSAFLLLYSPAVASWFYPKGHETPLTMDPREAYEIAARILGVFSLISAINPASGIVAQLFVPGSGPWKAGSWQWAQLIQTALYLLCGVSLVVGAPKIACNWFHSKQLHDERATTGAIGPRDVYKISTRLLGLFCFVSAIRPVSNIASEVFAPRSYGLRAWIVETTLYIACGAILLLGASKFAALCTSSGEGNPQTQLEGSP